MEEATTQAPSVPPVPKVLLSKEERSKIMAEAAKRRWAKARKEKTKAKAAKVAVKTTAAKGSRKAQSAPPAKKRPPAPREFQSALKTAEKRLAKAILERSEAAAKYAVLSAEIPSLQQLILALSNPLGVQARAGIAPPSLEQIVGDQPLTYQNPPRQRQQAAVAVPQIPVPQQLHPANVQGRAGGGAVGVELDEGGAEEDENKFLNESAIAEGQWR